MGCFGADNGFLTGLTLVDRKIRKYDVGSVNLKHFLWTVPNRPLPRQEKTFLPVMRYCFAAVLIFGDSHSWPHNSQDILPRAPVLSKNFQQASLSLQNRTLPPSWNARPRSGRAQEKENIRPNALSSATGSFARYHFLCKEWCQMSES